MAMPGNAIATSDIATLAQNAAKEILNAVPHFKRLDRIARSMLIQKVMDAQDSAVARLRVACLADESFGSLHQGWLETEGMGSLVQNQMLATLFLKWAIDEECLSDLLYHCREFAKAGVGRARAYAAIAGATVDASAEVSPGFRIIPWAEVPDSFQKQLFDGSEGLQSSGFLVKPTIAVEIQGPERRILFPSYSESASTPRLAQHLISDNVTRFDDVIRCIVARTCRPVGLVGSWVHEDTRVARELTGAAYSYGANRFNATLFSASIDTAQVSSREVVELFTKLNRFSSKDGRVLRIVLDRVASALLEHDIVDKAIDTGIALEALLLHDTSPERSELKFRIAIRGAAYLGGSRVNRLGTFRLLKSAYDHRSRAVHVGELAKDLDRSQADLKAAQNVVTEICRRVILSSRFPNWDEDFVIGESASSKQGTGWKPFVPRFGYQRSSKGHPP